MLPIPQPGDDDLVGVGADLAPGTLLAAYRGGLFPMPAGDSGLLGWWSPQPRGVLPLDRLRVSRTLRRSTRRLPVTWDTDFAAVVAGCADPRRPFGWINGAIAEAYTELHRLGWAHSVETRTAQGDLVGGLYGVQVGGVFAGESMFHRVTDASKVALVALVEAMGGSDGARDGRLLDVQWVTGHLASLGAVAIDRADYLARLRRALALPPVLPPVR